jgi:peptidoglycan/xylan/chitin deacetylase (PgdA/CDA1 family)
MTALQQLFGRLRPALGPLLLVASIAPVLFVAVPLAKDEHERFESRYLDRDPLPAPDVTTPEARLPAFGGGVPVLAYHGIDEQGRYAVTREQFARQLAMLDAAGVETITVDQYASFLRGDPSGLPERPLLLTFDDGKLSSFRGADAVLERYGMNAVMYAIAGETEEGSEYYLAPDELSEMVESGRWEVQAHAGELHREIAYDAAGRTGPAYAYRAYADGGLETMAEYRQRVLGDIDDAVARLADDVDGFEDTTFSFPFGAYGQYGTNDPRIPRILPRLLGQRFDALFAQPSDARFTRPGPPGRVLDRFELHRRTTAGELRAWLVAGAREISDPRTQPRTSAARARG